jgi:hypothetical protein
MRWVGGVEGEVVGGFVFGFATGLVFEVELLLEMGLVDGLCVVKYEDGAAGVSGVETEVDGDVHADVVADGLRM